MFSDSTGKKMKRGEKKKIYSIFPGGYSEGERGRGKGGNMLLDRKKKTPMIVRGRRGKKPFFSLQLGGPG